MSKTNLSETEKALALHSALARVDVATVAVVTTERVGDRKRLAALARGVFSKLGIKGISVTAPNYSMAQSVDVRLPKRSDYKMENAWDVAADCPARSANNEAHDKVEAILLAAFPGTDNRSDYASDYFDYKWSIN